MQDKGTSYQLTANQGINEAGLDDLVLELNNDIDDIGIILSDIEMTMFDIRDSFKGPVSKSLSEKFQFYQNQIEIIKNNLLSYPNDLLNLKNSMLNNDKNIKTSFDKFSDELITEANKI